MSPGRTAAVPVSTGARYLLSAPAENFRHVECLGVSH